MSELNLTKTKNLIAEISELLLESRIDTIDPHSPATTGSLGGLLNSLHNQLLQAEAGLSNLEKVQASQGAAAAATPQHNVMAIEKELLDQFRQYERLVLIFNTQSSNTLQHHTSITIPPSNSSPLSSMEANIGRNTQVIRDRLNRAAAATSNSNTRSFGKLQNHQHDLPPSSTNNHLNDSELLQLQDRMLTNQDAQLDSLSTLLGRQKVIGLAIGEELESQVELLDEVDQRVDATQSSLRGAANRMDGFLASSSQGDKTCYTIVGLIILLILVIWLVRTF